METIDDFIGDGKPLAERWREFLFREYVPKSDLRKLVEALKEKDRCRADLDRFEIENGYMFSYMAIEKLLNGGE